MGLAQLPRAARGLVVAVYVAAAVAAVYGGLRHPLELGPTGWLVVLFAALAGSRTIELSTRAAVAIADPLILAALMTLGPNEATVAGAVSMGASCLRRTGGREPHRMLFNIGAIVVACTAMGGVWTGLAGVVADPVRLLLSAIAFHLVNTGIVALAIALTAGTPFPALWREHSRCTAPSLLGGVVVALAHAWLLAGLGALAVVTLLSTALLLYYALTIGSIHAGRASG